MSKLRLEEIRHEEIVEVVIDDYGYTGEGYVELEDGWLSVPGALPGERVRVAVEEGHEMSRRLFGQVTEVLEASEHRRDPLCGRDDVCRGCQLRHLTIPEELRYKQRTIREVVAKFADLSVDDQPDIEVVSPRPIRRDDAFRIRSSLTYATDDEGFELGLVTPIRPELVPMSECPALTGAARRLVSYVGEAIEGLAERPPAWRRPTEPGEAPEIGLGHIGVASPTFGRGLVDVEVKGAASREAFDALLDRDPMVEFLNTLLETVPEDVGVSVHAGEMREQVKPPDRVRFPLHGLRLVAGFDDWIPATLKPTEVLYDRVFELLELDAEDRYLDIGCGIGTLSLLAAPECEHVTGIDINRTSVESAELNALHNDRDNTTFVPSGWEKALRQLALDGQSFDVATINPMREPLGERPLAYLSQLGVDRLVYLGPSPASAAKDIGELRDKGWRVDWLGAANIHPATYHTMLVARLERGSSA